MNTVRVTESSQLESLKTVAIDLKEANAAVAAANNKAEACKDYISRWLSINRKINVADLPVGEIVIIEGVCMIEIASQNKFDAKEFLLAHPALHEEFKREFPMRKYKVLA